MQTVPSYVVRGRCAEPSRARPGAGKVMSAAERSCRPSTTSTERASRARRRTRRCATGVGAGRCLSPLASTPTMQGGGGMESGRPEFAVGGSRQSPSSRVGNSLTGSRASGVVRSAPGVPLSGPTGDGRVAVHHAGHRSRTTAIRCVKRATTRGSYDRSKAGASPRACRGGDGAAQVRGDARAFAQGGGAGRGSAGGHRLRRDTGLRGRSRTQLCRHGDRHHLGDAHPPSSTATTPWCSGARTA